MTAKSSTTNRLRGRDDASRFDSVQADERGAGKSFRVFKEGISRSCDGRLANAAFITSSNSTAVTELNNPARNSVAVGEKKVLKTALGRQQNRLLSVGRISAAASWLLFLRVYTESVPPPPLPPHALFFSLQPAEQSLALRLCEQMI